MDAVTFHRQPEWPDAPATLGVYLGSFDPPHRAHAWIIGRLRARCDAVAVLVPAVHFHKTPVPGRNASLAQRLEMLAALPVVASGRVAVGVAHEVLFVRLAAALRRDPGARSIVLALGDETFRRLQASRDYYARAGLPFTAADAALLSDLCRDALVFGRTTTAPGMFAVPDTLRGLSATAVRALLGSLRGAPTAADRRLLARHLHMETVDYLLDRGLYRVPSDR